MNLFDRPFVMFGSQSISAHGHVLSLSESDSPGDTVEFLEK